MVNARPWSQQRKVGAAGSWMHTLVENLTPTLDVQCLTLHTGFEARCLNPYVPICTSDRSMDISRPADMSVFRADIINYLYVYKYIVS